MISKLSNVEVFRGSAMGVQDIVDFGADHVVLATGSSWRRDGIGVVQEDAAEFPAELTPDDIFSGAAVKGPVVIYDDDNYFMGGALAEKLRQAGHEVTLVTPMATASSWTALTDEQFFVQKRLLEHGIKLVLLHGLKSHMPHEARLACVYTEREMIVPCETLVLVTGRVADDDLFTELDGRQSVTRIGDCLAPSSIADAVYSGHRFAREFGDNNAGAVLRRERPLVGSLAHG
jgi:dimethylamine/trimethylamine dehydrogenase